MKTVFVLFDSLNRHMLSPYGGARVPTPNFERLAARTQVFDKHFVGSMPCMPARRDLLTGRLTFLHRGWGPLEPFDNAFTENLQDHGVHSHLATDHYHYWEDGGATYHNRYTSFDFIRGQENDPWKAVVHPDWAKIGAKFHPSQVSTELGSKRSFYMTNREYINAEEEFPSSRTFARGFDFLDANRAADDWFLQIETFDPHEPFFAPDRFKDAFRTGWNGPIRDWPIYGRVEESIEEGNELRANYYATLAHCDFLLGRLLDYFDAHDMWKDTALIVSTDHGFLLGEHDFWAKNRMHLYQELAHIPLFIHDPRAPGSGRVDKLTQSIDIPATILDLYGLEPPAEAQGHSVLGTRMREAVLFGYFGGAVNVSDGRYTYHRFPADLATQEIYQYTLMPTHLSDRFATSELEHATLAPPFTWTKNVPVLKVPVGSRSPMYQNYGPGALLENDTRLYDLATDPQQAHPITDRAAEARMVALMVKLMRENEAPPEAFARLGLT